MFACISCIFRSTHEHTRIMYNASIFTMFGFIERGFVANWPGRKGKEHEA